MRYWYWIKKDKYDIAKENYFLGMLLQSQKLSTYPINIQLEMGDNDPFS